MPELGEVGSGIFGRKVEDVVVNKKYQSTRGVIGSQRESGQLRVAVVGCGAISERAHVPALLKLSSQFRITACVDRSCDRARQVAALVGQESACLDTVDDLGSYAELALVAVPPAAHLDTVCSLLQQGMHVLCEKPLARTTAECQIIVQTAASSRGSLAVAYNRRYYRSWRMLKILAEEGTVGRLVALNSEEGTVFDWPVGSSSFFDPAAAGGGALLDSGVHTLDLSLWLSAKPLRIVNYEDDARGGVEANARLIMEAGSEIHTIRLSRTHTLLNRVVATFEDAIITAECWDGNSYESCGWTHGAEKEIAHVFKQLEHDLPPDPFEAEWLAFYQNVGAGVSGMTDDLALKGVEVVEQCYQSRQELAQPWACVDVTHERSAVK